MKKQKTPSQRQPKNSFWGHHKPVAIAHRGGNAAGKERRNTLNAFQTAWDLGYKYAETDVILAASGELVLIHGSRNWLQAGFSRNIARPVLQKMTLEQIRYTLRPGGGQVPTLEEVLLAFPKMKFLIDLKTDEVVAPLAKLIKRLKVSGRVFIVGLDYNRNMELKKACAPAKVRIGLTVGRSVRLRNINMILLKSGRLSDIDAILMHHSLVSRPMIGLVHYRGLKAIVWTANSSLGIKHAIRSAADGIISDRVTLLKGILDSKTEKLEKQ
jgi:glycerophosphoryl diester phosphodiesterase